MERDEVAAARVCSEGVCVRVECLEGLRGRGRASARLCMPRGCGVGRDERGGERGAAAGYAERETCLSRPLRERSHAQHICTRPAIEMRRTRAPAPHRGHTRRGAEEQGYAGGWPVAEVLCHMCL